ncbi:Lectin C-type domain protein [Penicillium brasilianum]|uniref:Maintenance of telomere capping protein 6 n=1 Tax=Penicillium brasilianum TaxID=104259 RepID=A0A1S9RRP5_PENBI|nr:Lectin C-type domain protein [Penicillium brasilianum]
MSVSYDAENAISDATWLAVLLSERDVAGQVPVNFVTNPAVSLSSACFGNGLYARKDAAKCISNLLAVGYRRLVVDLYWSVERRTWTFCPVEIPARVDVMVSTYTSTTTEASTTSTITTETATTTSDAATATITGYTDSYGDTVYELGPYRCTDDLDLYTLSEVLVGYFEATTSQLLVYTTYLVLNLHAAGSDAEPSKPAKVVTGSDLPSSESERAGSFLNDALRQYLYTPRQLAKDRSNLNESWYQVDESYMPIVEYYTIHTDKAGVQSTPDGWPSAKYVQLAKADRMIIEYGSVDPQIAEFDFAQDENAIFPPGYLTTDVNVTATTNGTLTSGCLYKQDATAVSQANSSWALSNEIPVPDGLSTEDTMGSLTNVISDMTACGMSPMLNTTLFDQTADANVDHYRNVSLSTAWAWAMGEPEGADTGGGTGDTPSFDRCAFMDLSSEGHWRATNCSQTRRGACRIGHSPFSWTISNATAEYSNVSDTCPPGSNFAVPRTGLENTYLYKYLLTQPETIINPASNDATLREIYIDFNSIDVTSCWVSGGPEAQCPYGADPQQLERKTVLVAAIAGIVICIITALTLFVKCNANRRNSRRRTRMIKGWEYEGVPS